MCFVRVPTRLFFLFGDPSRLAPSFPMACALLPLTPRPLALQRWDLPDVTTVATVLGPMLEKHSGLHCKGASCALKPPSDRWVRVVATTFTAEISFVKGKTVDQA